LAKDNDKLVLTATTLAEGVLVYAAKSKGGLETGEKAEEIKLIKDGRIEVAYPAKLLITAKASDQGTDSSFELKVTFKDAAASKDVLPIVIA